MERHLSLKLAEDAPIKEIISELQKMASKASIPEQEVVILVGVYIFIPICKRDSVRTDVCWLDIADMVGSYVAC